MEETGLRSKLVSVTKSLEVQSQKLFATEKALTKARAQATVRTLQNMRLTARQYRSFARPSHRCLHADVKSSGLAPTKTILSLRKTSGTPQSDGDPAR